METYKNKYQNGKIYKITDTGYNKCYYGSTVQSLSMRMAEHRRHYTQHKHGGDRKATVYDLFDEYGIDNCKIELVELFSCNSKSELEAKEGFYIKNNDCVNKHQMGRTRKQYYEDNKDIILEYHKQYYKDNKDKILKYREENKDSIKIKKAECDRKYQLANKDRLNENRQEWYAANKNKLLEQISCPVCNATFVRCCKVRHERSKKHQQALTKTDEIENSVETII